MLQMEGHRSFTISTGTGVSAQGWRVEGGGNLPDETTETLRVPNKKTSDLNLVGVYLQLTNNVTLSD